jgi:SAM-dependent methyltransferase
MGTSRNPLIRAGYRGIKALGALRRFVLSRRIRSQVLTRLRHKDRHFQGETASYEDRYPALFAECQKRFADLPRPKILSFGCATGEEVFSLGGYLPQAEIVGVDINSWCLKQCVRRNTSERLRFLHSLSPEFAEMNGFDAIFCMAVFQRTEHRIDGAQPTHTGFTFERFQAEVGMLDRKLKPGGLFFLDQCDFSFEQTEIAGRYTPLEFEGNRVLRDRLLFGRDNRVMASEHYSLRCFVKQAEE